MTAIYLALAAGVAATTITKAKVFAPLRVFAKRANSWIGYLVSCPYCASHWLVFALQAVYQVRLGRLDPVVSAFPMIGAAVLVPALLTRLYSFSVDQPKMTWTKAEMREVFERHIDAHRTRIEPTDAVRMYERG